MSESFATFLQARLTAHGFACGGIDGTIGPATTTAIKAFESASGLPVDGLADATVVSLLRAAPKPVTPAVKAAIPNRDNDDDPAIQAIALVDQRWPRQKDVETVFGAVGTGLVTVEVPYEMVLSYDRGTRVRKMTLHRLVAPSALRVLQRVAETYSATDRTALGLDLFGGAYNPRRMRGGSKWSMHAYGIAMDFDPERNALHAHAPEARLSHADALAFWQLWEAEGWLPLGRARDFDWMHVQAARL